MNLQELAHFFKGKKVLVTGGSGFVGSWLSLVLSLCEAEIFSFSKEYKKEGIYFHQKSENIYTGDITHYEELVSVIKLIKPDYIFHLAAQPITLKAYEIPRETFLTNVIGTTNLLEAVRVGDNACKVVIVTSDKCYRNNEWIWGYRENDVLAGIDPYSASKSGAELVFNSYFHSYFQVQKHIRVASCRAGNVVGGGDWGAYRIVPDAIKAWTAEMPIMIRNPEAVRPWNYVLDIVYGYLLVACHLDMDTVNGQSFNFGPKGDNEISVKSVIDILWENWHKRTFPYMTLSGEPPSHFEHTYLKLNCDKAWSILKWQPKMNIHELLKSTASWYQQSAFQSKSLTALSTEFVHDYFLEK